MSDINDEINILVAGESGLWLSKEAGGLQRAWNDAKKEWRRGRNDLSEFLSPARMISEKFFSGYGKHMKHLRNIDAEIQNWLYDLDNCLDQAKDARKESRLLDVIFWLSQINDRLRLAATKGRELVDIHEDHINEFVGKGNQSIPDDYFSELPTDRKDISKRLVRASGMMEDFERWISNRKMQKIYARQLEKKKLAANHLYENARVCVANIEKVLEVMTSARISGDIGTYIEAIKSIAKEQGIFEKDFRKVYQENFADLASAMRRRRDELAKMQPQDTQEPTANGKVPPVLMPIRAPEPVFDRTQTHNSPYNPPTKLELTPQSEPTFEFAPDLVVREPDEIPLGKIPPLPPVPKLVRKLDTSSPVSDNLPDIESPMDEKLEEPAPTTSKSPGVLANLLDPLLLKKSHADFYAALEKLAITEDIGLMTEMISVYSEKIEDQDPATSQELLSLLAGMLNV